MRSTRMWKVALLAAAVALAACQRAEQPAPVDEAATPPADTAAPVDPAPPAQADAAAAGATDATADAAIQEGLRSTGTLSGTAWATPEALEEGQSWQSANVSEVQRITRQAEELSARTRAESDAIRRRMASRIPPELLTPGGSTSSPINIPITGDTIVVQNPVLARDVLALVGNAFLLHTGCARMERIHIRNRTVAGPFNTTPDGRLSSGLIVER